MDWFSCLEAFVLFIAISYVVAAKMSQPAVKGPRELLASSILNGDAASIQSILTAIDNANATDRSTQIISSAIETLRRLRVALLVIDFQVDFVNGTLPIGAGDAKEDPRKCIPNINQMIDEKSFDSLVFTKDWHPKDHISFISAARNPDRKLDPKYGKDYVFKVAEIATFIQPPVQQALYPDHCIQNSPGAEILPEIHQPSRSIYVDKGMDTLVDSYSAFMTNDKQPTHTLEQTLRGLGVNAVVGCGLAFDICVHYTLNDAADLGFYTAGVRDSSAALSKDGIVQTERDFANRSIPLIDHSTAIELVRKRTAFPAEWLLLAVKAVLASEKRE